MPTKPTPKSKDKKELIPFSQIAAKAFEDYNVEEPDNDLPTGSDVMDAVFGGKGIPRGIFIDFAAPPGIGKSSIALHACKTLCRLGETVIYIDVERGVNKSQIDGFNLSEHQYHPKENPDGRFHLLQHRTFKELDDYFTMLTKSDLHPALIVLDSITNLVPSKLTEAGVEDENIAIHSRLVTTTLKKYKAAFSDMQTTLLCINQVRNKITFNQPVKTEGAGGWAYKHNVDMSIEMRKFKSIDKEIVGPGGVKEKSPYGAIVKVWAVKSRRVPPYRPLYVCVYYGKGVSNAYSFAEMLLKTKEIVLNGSSYTIDIYPGQPPVKKNGMAAMHAYIANNIDQARKIVNSHGGFTLTSDVTVDSTVALPPGSKPEEEEDEELAFGDAEGEAETFSDD